MQCETNVSHLQSMCNTITRVKHDEIMTNATRKQDSYTTNTIRIYVLDNRRTLRMGHEHNSNTIRLQYEYNTKRVHRQHETNTHTIRIHYTHNTKTMHLQHEYTTNAIRIQHGELYEHNRNTVRVP